MKFRTLLILTSLLLFSFLVFIFFTLNEGKASDAHKIFNENNKRFEKIARILLDQDYLYRVAKMGFAQDIITIDPRTGKPFTVKINTVAGIDSDMYNGITFNDFCSEYKLDQELIKEMVNLLIDEDIFYIKELW
jgi:hypothetical protein